MIYGIVASQSVIRSAMRVLFDRLESDTVLPVITFGGISFELADGGGEVPNEAEIIEMVFGGLAEGFRIEPNNGFYTNNPNMQMRCKFSRGLDVGANEDLVLEFSPQLGGDGENWNTTTGNYEAIEGEIGQYLVSDVRYEDHGISYRLEQARDFYYRVSLRNSTGDVLEVSPPVRFTFYADDARTPEDTVRFYFDDLFALQMAEVASGDDLFGFHDNNNHSVFWTHDSRADLIGPNSMTWDASIQRIRPKPAVGISAIHTAFEFGTDWNQALVRAKIFCPPSTPGLGAGSGMIFVKDDGTELYRWFWQGDKLKFVTDAGTDEYTVPGGTTSLNVEIALVQTSFAVVNRVVSDIYETVWAGNNPSIIAAVDLSQTIHVILFGGDNGEVPPTAVDSWANVIFRATTSSFDPGQAN